MTCQWNVHAKIAKSFIKCQFFKDLIANPTTVLPVDLNIFIGFVLPILNIFILLFFIKLLLYYDFN